MGSMAQPRNRVKYSIDPNVLNWANDENKFGQKMMEKMGWTSGKGLGANEDGMIDHIKVRVKSDNKGIGFSKQEYDNVWLDHQDDFEAVLNSLNQSNGVKPMVEEEKEEKINLLENKSKNRGRLHYSKFAKSKDLSLRSSTDIDLILGRHKRKKKKANNSSDSDERSAQAQKIDKNTDSEEDGVRPSFQLNPWQINAPEKSTKKDEPSDEATQFSTNPLSISAYFAKKMNKSLANKETVGESNESEQVGVEMDSSKIKREKKRKRKALVDNDEDDSKEMNPPLEEVVQNDSELDSTARKSKKSKKTKKSKEKENGFENRMIESVDDKQSESVEELSTEKVKKLKKNKEATEEVQKSNVETNEINELKQKRNKKSKKNKDKKCERVAEETNGKRLESKPDELNIDRVFKGSNLSETYGYSPYNINCSIDELLDDKCRKVNKKRNDMVKNLEKDPKFYEMNKKKMVG